ncbi:MAG: hypothetical protein GQ574_14440 [Crocinitomix sp.]|nr:hypothetical protein [Crocinitomix sp.]
MNKIVLITLLMLVLFGCAGNLENAADLSVINPPFEGIDVPFNTYQIDPTTESTIQTERGTVIKIPANAIVDENGVLITEEVDINYRPFHSSAEIIASGIPMGYDSLGQNYDFVSAGMFELTAEVNGQSVNVKEGKTIDMEFAAFNGNDGFNFYTLDETTGDWSFVEPSTAVENERKIEQIQDFRDDFIIELDIDYRANPELKIFDKMSWIYSGDDTEEDPTKNPWIFEEKWRDIQLSAIDADQGLYNMHLKSKSKTLDLTVSPYIEGDEATYLAALNDGILALNEAVETRKDEELSLRMQANMVRKFSVSSFGICNIDTIRRLLESEELFATNANFNIKNQTINEAGKIILLSGNEKTMVSRHDTNWPQMTFKADEENTLLFILPKNEIALCGQSEFNKAKKNPDYEFKFTDYRKIKDLEDFENLLAGL